MKKYMILNKFYTPEYGEYVTTEEADLYSFLKENNISEFED